MTTTDWTIILAVGSFLLVLANIIGGYLTLRSAKSKAAQEIETRVREALEAENKILQDRLERVEEDYEQIRDDMELVKEALKEVGIFLEIDSGTVRIKDKSGSNIVVMRPKRTRSKTKITKAATSAESKELP